MTVQNVVWKYCSYKCVSHIYQVQRSHTKIHAMLIHVFNCHCRHENDVTFLIYGTVGREYCRLGNCHVINRAEDVKSEILYYQLWGQNQTYMWQHVHMGWCVTCSPCTLTVMFTSVCCPAVLLTTQRYSPASSRRILVVLKTMKPLDGFTSPSPSTCLRSIRVSLGARGLSPPEGREW